MEKEKLMLPNRYNIDVYLLKESPNQYKLVVSSDEYFTYNVSKINETDYRFIDPSGGPMLSLDDSIPNGEKIKRIYENDKQFIIETYNG